MRVSERQERVLRAAADLSGETLTGFVLSVATERAEQVLERAQRISIFGFRDLDDWRLWRGLTDIARALACP